MSNHCDDNEEHTKLFETIVTREILEDRAIATLTSDTLQRLNITLERLPRNSQTLLEQVSENMVDLQFQELDPISISLHKSREVSEKLEDEYELLKWRQKNVELQTRIDRNNRFLTQLRKDLENSKKDLWSQNPNPDSIDEFIRQSKQKLTTYEEGYELAKNKYSSLKVPEAILPKSIQAQIASLQALHQEAITYKAQADDIILIKQTKAMLIKLKK